MRVLSPLRSSNDERKGEMDIFPANFPDFEAGNLLDSIDFDDIFSDIGDGDVLPDLEMDPEILAEFSVSSGEELDMKSSILVRNGEEEKGLGFGSSSCSGSGLSFTHGEEIVSKRDESIMANPPPKDTNSRGEKSAMPSKSSHGKRKVKVDWTPELHRRFVQAVEHLGVDKAVPSRILELMGIDCLTRHNIASHLQKYRSHRKHLLAREAEAASWSQRRQMYGGGGGGSKREMRPWTDTAPIMGFPPTSLQPFRPLHVWGHPTVDQSLVHIWPKHLIHSSSPPPPHWAPPPPDPSYWHPLHQRVPNALAPGTPCFPQPLQPTMRFPTPPVPGIPPLSMYKVDHSMAIPSGQLDPHPLFDFHPSKESIDAAIGDVLSKPWLPLPLGLKQPSVESVLVELQHHGVPKIPSSCV